MGPPPRARLSMAELQKIVERDLPGHEIVERAEDAGGPRAAPEADEIAPAIGALRKKFGVRAEDADAVPGEDVGDVPADEIVTVRPKEAADAEDSGPGPKAVVISGRERRVVSSQG